MRPHCDRGRDGSDRFQHDRIGVARVAPYFSLAEGARFIDARIAPNDKVIYEGRMHVGSSLLFYLERKFYLVNQDPGREPGAAP